MKKNIFYIIIFIVFLLILLGGLFAFNVYRQTEITASDIPAIVEEIAGKTDEQTIRETVENFGLSIKSVNIFAPTEDAVAALDRSYGNYVSSELLDEWKTDPLGAVGYTGSDSWPDRIEIENVTEEDAQTYVIRGSVVEMTGPDQANGQESGRYEVSLKIRKMDGKWLITEFSTGTLDQTINWVDFENDDFRLRYPSEIIVNATSSEASSTMLSLSFSDEAFRGEQSNIIKAGLTVGEAEGLESKSDCADFSDLSETAATGTEAKKINGIDFYRQSSLEPVAGGRLDRRLYRTVKGGKCYEIILSVLIKADAVTSTVTSDSEKAFSTLENILNTFTFK